MPGILGEYRDGRVCIKGRVSTLPVHLPACTYTPLNSCYTWKVGTIKPAWIEREIIVTYLGQERGVGEEAISRKERVAELRNRTQTPNAEVSVGQTLAKLELLVEGTKQGTTSGEEDLRHSGGPSLHLLQADRAADRRRA